MYRQFLSSNILIFILCLIDFNLEVENCWKPNCQRVNPIHLIWFLLPIYTVFTRCSLDKSWISLIWAPWARKLHIRVDLSTYILSLLCSKTLLKNAQRFRKSLDKWDYIWIYWIHVHKSKQIDHVSLGGHWEWSLGIKYRYILYKQEPKNIPHNHFDLTPQFL